MLRLRALIEENLIFFLLLLLYFVAGAALLVFFPKGTPELWLNGFHNSLFDVFFSVVTYLGDGILAVIFILLVLLFQSRRKAMLYALCLITSSLVIQAIKIQLNMPRPKKFFSELKGVYYIEHLDIHSSFSFPSGHTGQAFSLFLLATLFVKNKRWSYLFFSLAYCTAMSRVYLMQHFTMDVWAGGLIAVLVSTPLFLWIAPYLKSELDTPLIRFKSGK